MKEIALTKGYVTLVDDEDFEWLRQWRWSAAEVSGKGRFVYAGRGQKQTINGHKIQQRIYMHRLIAGAGKGVVVDHINHNTLDNRRCNLRAVSPSENLANNRRVAGISGYRGVTRKGPFHYVARAGRAAKVVSYNTAAAAALGYDEMAFARWGECARLNFPELRRNGKEQVAG